MTNPADTQNSSSSSAENTNSSTIPQIQVHHLISVKLDNENYLLWLTQFHPLLHGYNLEGYVDGSFQCPARLLPDSDEINPAYTNWKKQDKILLGWLLSSLSEPVLAQVVGLNTSREVWESLRRHFSSQSHARTLHLKRELQNIHKGNKTMVEYYLHAKKIIDKLAASGHAVSSTDLQHMMLSGLDSSYDPIVIVLTATVADIHIDDFYSNLLAFDLWLETQNANFPTPAANLAHRGNTRSYMPNNSRDRGPSNSNRKSYGKAQCMPSASTQGPCQICSHKNHSALQCWYRFHCQYNAASSASENPSAAYVAAPGSLLDGNWCPDSDATHTTPHLRLEQPSHPQPI